MSAAGKPLKAGEIAEAAGLDKKVVERSYGCPEKRGQNCISGALCLGSEEIE